MKSIIVAVDYYSNLNKLNNLIEELIELNKACDIETMYQLIQKLPQPNSTSYIGKGKLGELLHIIEQEAIDVVVFNEELTPTQMKYLSTVIPCEISDRTGIILKIFEERAKTRQAKLQVEVATLHYLLPRLVGGNAEKIGQLGGSGFRGSGEKQIELDRRKIRDRIARINRELEESGSKRKVQKNKRYRSEIPIVALVGYTNSGKSTIMNHYMANKDTKKVFEEDTLFASLQTSTRLVELEDNVKFLLIDTVGFVQDLPKHLFKAFRSTLEEIVEASLLLQVVDSSNQLCEDQIEVTNSILKELKADHIPMIYVYNKVDLNKYGLIRLRQPNIFISAKNNINMDILTKRIVDELSKNDSYQKIKIPYEKIEDFIKISRQLRILSTKYLDDGVYSEVICPINKLYFIQEYILVN